ncbi:MAG TPA: cytochrome c oxidase subunit II [Arenibaculum sp.]|nr:cytochrome c oxidase subunit II [Arenibaculum sp.]
MTLRSAMPSLATFRFRFGLAAVLLLAACGGPQSVFEPRGPDAERLLTLTWVLFIGGTAIFVGVMGLIGYALVARPDRTRRLSGNHLVLWGGFVFPIVTLAVLTTYSAWTTSALTATPREEPLRVEVIGHMWWWEVRYPGEPGMPDAVTANEIRIPVGRPVEVTVTTADVIHSFWVPNLHGKIDLIPGHVNRRVITAHEPAVMRGQCAEFCGAQHAWMAFAVVAEEPERFEEWLERQREPAPEPREPLLREGREAFIAQGCGACHRVRGVPLAEGDLGPDLTHVGSRHLIAAGRLENGVGALAGWIASSQHLKPENLMPSFDRLDGPTLRAIARWLESLE